MQIPRDETLAEVLYRDIDKNEYLNEIYSNLLFNYSAKMFHSEEQLKEINIMHALRFADLLSKSTYEPVADKHKLWGQEIGILPGIYETFVARGQAGTEGKQTGR